MTPLSPQPYLLKAQKFYNLYPLLTPTHSFVVTKTDWDGSHTLDFYSVKEVDCKEGRIEGVSAGYWQSKGNQWGLRSPNKIDFWVYSFDAQSQIYTVSFVHPEDSQQIDGIECSFAFGCSEGLAIASIGNRDKQRKFKLRMEQLQGKGSVATIQEMLFLPGL